MGLARRIVRAFPAFWANQLKDPIFVVGFNNSGKSTVVRTLRRNTGILVYPDEGNAELWFRGHFPWILSDKRIGPIWSGPDAFIRQVLEARSDDFLEARAQLGAYQWLNGRKRLLNDSGMLAALAPEIMNRFPDAKFVHFLRDGIVSSYLTARIEWTAIMRSPEKYMRHGLPLDFPSVLTHMARYWAWTVERMDQIARARPGQVLELRYEEWCREPARVIRQILSFLGLEDPGAELQDLTPIRDLTPLILSEISREEWDLLAGALGPTLAAKGYLVRDKSKP